MQSIAPYRSRITDRFPVASFEVTVPPTRCFEVACATDPRLFHTAHRRARTPQNFYSTRAHGLLRAPEGRTAWFVPPDQLQRFAGAPRLYYALGSYGGLAGESPQFTIAPQSLEQVPSIALGPGFTGRSLDRSRLFGGVSHATAAYGAPEPGTLRWGGDDVLEAQNREAAKMTSDEEYDDGLGPELWRDDVEREADGGNAETRADDDVPAAQQLAYDEALELEDDETPVGTALGEDCFDYADDEAAAHPQSETVAVASGATAESEAPTPDRYAEYEHELDEPAGYEDAAAVYGAVGYREADESVAVLEPATETDVEVERDEAAIEHVAHEDSDAQLAEPMGRDPEYREEAVEEEFLPPGAAAVALGRIALDIPEKIRILRVVAIAESGRDGYSAINPSREYDDPSHPAYRRYHIGLSWGFIQFTQRSGALGRVLRAIQRREAQLPDLSEAHRFATLFGPHWEELLRVTTASDPEARVAPVGGARLWEPVWTDRFREAGRVPHVQAAQNEIAVTDYFDPNLRIALWLGFDTPRALAMLVDRCIHMGNGGGRSWVLRTVGPVRTQADRDNALRALGHADLRAFQQSYAPHLRADNRWGPQTHAAMTDALRRLGERSPLPVADRDTMLQRMVDAAAGARFRRRLTALHTNRTDFSDDTTYALD